VHVLWSLRQVHRYLWVKYVLLSLLKFSLEHRNWSSLLTAVKLHCDYFVVSLQWRDWAHHWLVVVCVVEVRGLTQQCLRTMLQLMSTWQQWHHSGWWRRQSTLVTIDSQTLPLPTLSMSLLTSSSRSFIIPQTSLLRQSPMAQRYNVELTFYCCCHCWLVTMGCSSFNYCVCCYHTIMSDLVEKFSQINLSVRCQVLI